ncbi:MAG: methylmalonyl-CoA mutase family protein [Candidatus Heimdallarchaeota archaeon]|nr:methylmalonyl-CoA mutase family protein [Candidatus Heimdallarchaeota archaeon]
MKEIKKTLSGIEVPNLIENHEVIDNSNPGEFPYTRGVYPTMYRGRTWTMRQYSGFSTAKETNNRFQLLLKRGQTGLSVAFDLPTQMGYDSDDPFVKGEIGKVGVAIDTVEDMKILFNNINLGEVSTSMTINAPAMILLAMYIVVAEENGINPKELRGTIQNDILKEYIARGTYIFPPEPSMRLITDIFSYCSEYLPKFNTISISGYHIREAGSTAIQELAFTLTNAREYVRAALKSGLDIDSFADRLSFFFNAHNDFFEEIAKFRAARRMWAKMMKEDFSAKNEKSMMLRFHTQTAGSTLTAQQQENNIVRVTLQALSAVLGGTQSLHTNSKDEALALPTDNSAITALRTQQIIATESGVINTTDPLGGSFYVEWLTDKLEEESLKLIKEIENIGVIEAINKGIIQSKIHESAYVHEKLLEKQERIVVGVNKYKQDDHTKPELLKIDDSIGDAQIEFLNSIKINRDNNAVLENLDRLKEAAIKNENIFPFVIDCVRSRASIGEICSKLREVFGKYQPPSFI